MHRTCFVLFALALSVGAVNAAPEAQRDPLDPPTVDALNRSLRGIRGNIRNATMRLRNGVSGPLGEGASVRGATPGRSCCAGNIDRMRKRVRELVAILERYDRYFRAVGDDVGMDAVQRVQGRVGQLVVAVDAFEQVEAPSRSEAALQAVTKVFLHLREDADGFIGCCAPAAPPPGS